jgi:hypothetical protein
MKFVAHFQMHRDTYRRIALFLAIASALGYFWGTHPLWEVSPTVAFGVILAAQAKRTTLSSVAGVGFVLALPPTIFSLYERLSYLWNVPYPHPVDIAFETVLTIALLWVLFAGGTLLLGPSSNERHAT